MNNTIYKSISEVSKELNIPRHTLRFWESKFTYLNPKKVAGSRFYTNADIQLIKKIHHALKIQGYTIKGVLTIMREIGIDNFRSGKDATESQAQEIRKELPLYGNSSKADEPPLPMFADSITTASHPLPTMNVTLVKIALSRLKILRRSLS